MGSSFIPVSPNSNPSLLGVFNPPVYSVAIQADVPNNVAGSFISIIVPVPVVGVGESWHFHWHLWIGSQAAVAGGINCRINTPVTAQLLRSHWLALGATSGTVVHQSQPPNQPAGTFVAYDASATNVEGMVDVNCTVNGVTAGGAIDLTFAPITNGQNYIVRRGSYMEVWKV